MKQVLLVLIVVLNVLTVGAKKYIVKNIGIDRGLSSNYITAIEQDKRGFIWMATEEGLNRFDGLRFYTFYKNKNVSTGITGNELNCLLDDVDEPVMWIGTQRFGLNAYNYDTKSFTHYRHSDSNPHSICTDDITSINTAANGNIWVSTYWKGIDLFDKKTGRFTHFNTSNVKGMPSNSVWCVLDVGKNSIYVGHVKTGLSIVNTRTRKAVNFRHNPLVPTSIASDEVNSLFRDRAGRIWVGTGNGLDLFNPATKQFFHFTDHGRLNCKVFDICEFSDGRLWIATEQGGVAIIDVSNLMFAGSDVKVEYITAGKDDNGISGNTARCLLEDKYNNVWIGQYGEGVDFLTYRMPLFMQIKYSPFATPSFLTVKAVLSVCQDRTGKLWIGTDGDGINIFSADGQRTGTVALGEKASVQAAYCDSRGQLWFGCFGGGAYVYSSGTMKQVFADSPNEDVRSFYEDRSGQMWIGTSNGVYVVDIINKVVKRHINVRHSLVRSISIDNEGRVWIGTFGGGLLVYSPQMKLIRQFSTNTSFPSNTVNQVMYDRQKRMWVCTAEGLVCFADSHSFKYRLYDNDNNLDNIHIRAIAEDRAGNIWVSTNKGISCMRRGASRFFNYSYKDNIPVGNFSAQSVATGADGTIYFGSNGGLCYFNPSRVLANRTAPPAIITRMMVYDEDSQKDSMVSVIGRQQVSLEYWQNTFTVSFSSQDFSLEDEVEFSYKLEGLQDNWTTIANNEITFRNIPPGDYKLLVRSRLRNKEWNTDTASVDITIQPPLWLTWWAKLFYIVCICAVLWLVLRYYNRNLHLRYLYEADKKSREQEQKLNNERLQFYTNITHELRTPLTLIIGPLEDLINDSGLSQTVLRRVTVIRNSAIRLNNLVSKILEFRKVDTDSRKLLVGRGNIVAIIREICSKYEELNQKPDVKILFKASQSIINVYFDKEVINIIVDNLVSNAMKYTDYGQIVISVSLIKSDTDMLEIAVKDTGYGISADALPHIFDRYYQERGPHQASGTGIGLSLVQSMVQLHEGTITVESKPEEGSTFRVRLLADNTYALAVHYNAPEKKPEPEPLPDAGEKQEQKQQIMLIVEDNKDICEYIAESFGDEFEIVTAENGREGLKVAFRFIPDVIISDIMMPYMDGIEMCRKLKADVRTNHIPIILLTAKDSMESKEEGYESGADSYITKPFVRSLIASRVSNLLRQRRLLAQTYNGATETNSREIQKKREILREAMTKIDREFLDHIDKLIKERVASDKVDIDYMAEKLNISASTLYRKMKALTGLSANEYIRKYKMSYAERLLLEGKYTISEIGYMVGMNTTAYFRKCFKDEFGDNPSDYLNKIK